MSRQPIAHDKDYVEGRRDRQLVVFRHDAPKLAPITWIDPNQPDRISLMKICARVLPLVVVGGLLVLAHDAALI